MDAKGPFSQERLNEIFKISPQKSDRLASRESSSLEFKESFGWQSIAKYLRSCAAFANNKGGYIVFGVKNSPHILKGLSGKGLEAFESIDPAQFSGHLGAHCSPEIQWDVHQYELSGKTFGILYIYEALEKPVICCKDGGEELREGDIYYRYRGRSQRIQYPELREIMRQSLERERQFWMKHFQNIGRIGVQNAGIFDLKSGTVEGTSGTFLIDESLLDKLTFIKEGEFTPSHGTPTLKLMGDLKPVSALQMASGKSTVVKSKGIRVGDIVNTFLDLQAVSDPEDYVCQICFETSSFLPVYFFLKQAQLTSEEGVILLQEVVSRLPAKDKLIERLETKSTNHQVISTSDHPSAVRKREYIKKLTTKSISKSLTGKDLELALWAIRGLSKAEVKQHSAYIRELLRLWFNKHYEGSTGAIADNLRRAICWVDEALYMAR